METHVTLEYPNGRMVLRAVHLRVKLEPGMTFELHGRRWRAVGWESAWSTRPIGNRLDSMRCKPG